MASVSSRPERKLDERVTPRAIALVKYLPPILRRAAPLVPTPFAWPSPVCQVDSRICEECGERAHEFARGQIHEASSQSLRSGGRVKSQRDLITQPGVGARSPCPSAYAGC